MSENYIIKSYKNIKIILYVSLIILFLIQIFFIKNNQQLVFEKNNDKYIHVLYFIMLTFLGLQSNYFVIFTLQFAITSELLQLLIEYRTYSTVDVLANFMGVVIAFVIYNIYKKTHIFKNLKDS